ncbi:MAG TPA: Holliday junction branch migration protein RuvA, partial [Atopostipes sp.]|nr:Holliday junction branch migration protein RuvA [Atopostipes sp.]
MYEYIKGTVEEVNPSYLVLDNNGIGYHVLMANPFRLASQLKKDTTVYIYYGVSQDDVRLYGFINKEEKELFLKLIGVSGIGPKSALAILAAEDHVGLIQAIEEENVKYLQKFPGVG